MKVLHISSADDSQGSAKCLYEILEYESICDDIVPVVLTPIKTEVNSFCNGRGIENHVIGMPECFYTIHDKFWQIKYWLRKIEYCIERKKFFGKLEKLIDISKIDIIHTNNSIIDVGNLMSVKYSIPHIWHLREGGLKPFNNIPYFSNYIKEWKESDTTFVAVSEATKKIWIELGIPERKITVIYDGVYYPTNKIVKEKNFNEGSSDVTKLIMSGGINHIKGIKEVVVAINGLPDEIKRRVCLDIWGKEDKEYCIQIKEYVKNNGLTDTVRLMGFTSDIWGILNEYDVGINCTNFEAFGRSTVEFLMSGLPVIASNTGANPELIRDGINGILFNRSSADSLRNALIKLINRKTEFISNAMAEREIMIKKYSSENSCRKLESLFRNILIRESR